jgi:hypothetical protein
MENKPPIRVRKSINKKNPKNNKYHFNPNCQNYPKIEREGEEVLCFHTTEEAEKLGYQPCAKGCPKN